MNDNKTYDILYYNVLLRRYIIFLEVDNDYFVIKTLIFHIYINS